MAANKYVEFQVRLSDPKTEASTWSIADTDKFVSQLEREIHGITLNEQMWFNKELLIHLIEYEALSQAIGIQKLRKTIKQCVIDFGDPKMHLGSHISY
jgi:hypothetical protein